MVHLSGLRVAIFSFCTVSALLYYIDSGVVLLPLVLFLLLCRVTLEFVLLIAIIIVPSRSNPHV